MRVEANMTAVLDEAMRALVALDVERLEELEAQAAVIEDKGRAFEEKKQLIAMLLKHCRANRNALHRVWSRNTGATWVH